MTRLARTPAHPAPRLRGALHRPRHAVHRRRLARRGRLPPAGRLAGHGRHRRPRPGRHHRRVADADRGGARPVHRDRRHHRGRAVRAAGVVPVVAGTGLQRHPRLDRGHPPGRRPRCRRGARRHALLQQARPADARRPLPGHRRRGRPADRRLQRARPDRRQRRGRHVPPARRAPAGHRGQGGERQHRADRGHLPRPAARRGRALGRRRGDPRGPRDGRRRRDLRGEQRGPGRGRGDGRRLARGRPGRRRAGSTTGSCRCSGRTSRARPTRSRRRPRWWRWACSTTTPLRAPLLPLADAPRERLVDAAPDARPRRRRRSPGRGARPGWPRDRPGARPGGRRSRRPSSTDLDSGSRRAALPDPSSPGGWRADPEVKAAILARFRDRATVEWDLGGALRFRDRVGLPVKDLLAGPWRVVPGGIVGPGRRRTSAPGVVIMPPSFVNVGAWIGEDTMVDSHVLVGSCAQVGARVHLSAGRDDRRRARARRRTAGHRRGRRVRRRGLVAARGRARRGRRGDRRRASC